MRVNVFYFDEDFVAEGRRGGENFAFCCHRGEEEGFPDFSHDFNHNFLLGVTGVDFEADDYGEVAVVCKTRNVLDNDFPLSERFTW